MDVENNCFHEKRQIQKKNIAEDGLQDVKKAVKIFGYIK